MAHCAARVLYLVTDYVPGKLSDEVERAGYTPASMIRLTDQILQAVAFMHSKVEDWTPPLSLALSFSVLLAHATLFPDLRSV